MAYRVLIVDDKVVVRETIHDILLDFDCYVLDAETGETALELLEATTFHVIFLDVKLPGISGIELLRRTRECARELGKVIMLTGVPEAHTRIEAAQLGAFRYLSKTPLSREDVRRAFLDAVCGCQLQPATENPGRKGC
jgi:DNA-binding response OmpR family regulator